MKNLCVVASGPTQAVAWEIDAQRSRRVRHPTVSLTGPDDVNGDFGG
jgi:hypothetical protein